MFGASLTCACVIVSPDFDDPTDGVGTTLAATASESSSTEAAETSATGGDAGSGTDSGTSTGGDATTDASTTDASTTAVDAEPLTLKNFGDPANCVVGLHCAYMDKSPAPARHRAAECFEAPIEPPFEVSRIGVHPRAVLGQANVQLEVFLYDDMTQWFGDLLAEQDVGQAAPGDGYKSFDFNQPVVVNEKRFCVGYETTGPETQLAPAVDLQSPVAGTSVVRMTAGGMGCDTMAERLTEIYPMPDDTPRFCLEVDIAPL
ncbi:MAG: hypothetical protein KC486_07400 [Myxococcales bacterium]|nr:hypothetical protein [Myxococcales bacterium]